MLSSATCASYWAKASAAASASAAGPHKVAFSLHLRTRNFRSHRHPPSQVPKAAKRVPAQQNITAPSASISTSSASSSPTATSATATAVTAPEGVPAMAPATNETATSGGSVRQLVADLVSQSLAATFPGLAPVGVVQVEGEKAPEAPREFVPLVTACGNPKFGDYQCNNAMGIWSKIKGTPAAEPFKNPNGVGQALKDNLPASPMVSQTSLAGPGFLNITLSDAWLAQRVKDVAAAGSLAAWAPRLGVNRALVDFSSPNIAKEMHVGHLRSTIIGDTIARMLEYCHVEVLRRNHVGDWGTQFGMLIEFLFEQFPDWETVGEQRIGDLQAFYKAAKKKFDEDPAFKEKAQRAVVKLQGGEPVYRQAWAKICDVSRKEFDAVYQRLGVKLEEKGESFYNPIIPDVLEKLKSVGLVTESEGAQCIWVEGHKVPLIVVKSDGGFNYATTDLACIWYRINEEKSEWVIYVTDVGQSQHFDMFFKAARMAKWLPPEPVKDKEVEGKGGKGGKGGDAKGKKGKGKAEAKGGDGGQVGAGADAGSQNDSARKETEKGEEDKGTVLASSLNQMALDALPPPPNVRVSHVGFGLVLGEDGKRFRTRSSEVVRLVDLLDEAKARAKKGMEERERNVDWTDQEVDHAAEALGYGAVKYADLKNNRTTDYKFDFDQMLDMKGNTAVYLLYAHARICSIIRKSGQDPQKLAQDPTMTMNLVHPSERALVLHLCRFPEIVEESIENLLPNTLCEYLYNLSGDFTTFYTSCPVIDSPEMKSRLVLCEAAALVMRQCFQLLGITPLYRL